MPQTTRERYERERADLLRLAATFKRRHHYMSRNRDGAYSATDLNLALFAADVATSLAQHITELMEKPKIKVRNPEKHNLSHLQWYEQAEREDIFQGEAEDRKNLIAAWCSS